LVIKIVRGATDLGLKDTKDLVESAPVEVKKGLSMAEAQALVDSLKAAGASAELQ
jgi:large subunit ribosomal protein L7/L12